jgi:flagellar basal-body rod protein FlgF/flagellar basal-body rod protein FlgG
MPYGLYIAAEGAYSQSKRMEVLSNNLANVDTPGFKRDLALFQARYAEETARGQDHHGSGTINDVGGGVWMNRTVTDHSQGTLKRTEVPTDIAINGDGYFVVQKDGRNYLTRAGNFLLNNNGMLTTQTGMPVLSDAGGPILINPETPWRVSPDGAIEQDGGKTYLALVQPPSPADLEKRGENLFEALAAPAAIPAELRSVQGNYLEMSGVRPTLEMLELIETSRAFEMNVSMIRNHDAMLNSLVNRVLRQA